MHGSRVGAGFIADHVKRVSVDKPLASQAGPSGHLAGCSLGSNVWLYFVR